MSTLRNIPVNKLRDVIESLFINSGLSDKDAVIVADVLIEAELYGKTTHGIGMVPAHIKKLNQSYTLNAPFEIERTAAAISVCNANNSIGMLSAYKGMELAIQKAKSAGGHTVFCHNCNTFSAASYYVKMAAEAGMIGVAFSNTPPQMAPWGGKEKLLGTNPLAISVPTNKENPFIFDMATSTVAKSKINEAYHSGVEKIPMGWATDINGIPTDSPAEAVKGLLLPMAGPKGYGLCVAIDMISGMLSGAAYLDGVGKFYSSDNRGMNVGHTFIALDPRVIYGEDFYDKADDYVKRVRNSQSLNEKMVRLPGDMSLKNKQDKLISGIDLPVRVIDELNCLICERQLDKDKLELL